MQERKLLFVIDDDRDPTLSKNFVNSLRKFHDEKDMDIKVVKRTDEKAWVDDPHFYYRAKSVIAKKYIKDYDLIIGCDADQIIMGDLDFVLNSTGWDVGTVLNWNRVDPRAYGKITVWNVDPKEYFNCGLVAMRSERFVDHFYKMCFTKYFNDYQYREQDLLNIILHYGDYKVKCFDRYDDIYEYSAWHGLIAKGEGLRMRIVDGKVILPKGKDGYPNRDKEIKAYHFAGGKGASKNHRLCFNEKMIEHIDWLISDDKPKTKK